MRPSVHVTPAGQPSQIPRTVRRPSTRAHDDHGPRTRKLLDSATICPASLYNSCHERPHFDYGRTAGLPGPDSESMQSVPPFSPGRRSVTRRRSDTALPNGTGRRSGRSPDCVTPGRCNPTSPSVENQPASPLQHQDPDQTRAMALNRAHAVHHLQSSAGISLVYHQQTKNLLGRTHTRPGTAPCPCPQSRTAKPGLPLGPVNYHAAALSRSAPRCPSSTERSQHQVSTGGVSTGDDVGF